jgi:hypothetical protein
MLMVLLANISSADILKTVVLSATGAVVSYAVSLGIRRLVNWWKSRKGQNKNPAFERGFALCQLVFKKIFDQIFLNSVEHTKLFYGNKLVRGFTECFFDSLNNTSCCTIAETSYVFYIFWI